MHFLPWIDEASFVDTEIFLKSKYCQKKEEELQKALKMPDSLLSFSCCMSLIGNMISLQILLHLDYPGYI